MNEGIYDGVALAQIVLGINLVLRPRWKRWESGRCKVVVVIIIMFIVMFIILMIRVMIFIAGRGKASKEEQGCKC